MKPTFLLSIILVFGLVLHSGWASDACIDQAITTTASMQVSDGSNFDTESFFQSDVTDASVTFRGVPGQARGGSSLPRIAWAMRT